LKTSRETFAGRRRAPDLFGLERGALYLIAAAWTGAAILLSVARIRFGLPWPAAVLATVSPALVVTFAALFLIQGKPRGYLIDWTEERLLGQRDADLCGRRPPSPPCHAPQPRP
jgi:hypothetical protein